MMVRKRKLLFALAVCTAVLAVLLVLGPASLAQASPPAQIPTGSIPTVTSTLVGALVVVVENEQGYVNLRAGPNTVGYDIVGMLVTGQQAPAVGRTVGGDWIEIAYPGVQGGVAWVWKDLVELRGTPPIVEPPPTVTPAVTATIDPTLAAQFLVEAPATRLPTYTAPPPYVSPTMPSDSAVAIPTRIPMGLVIIGLAVIGVLGTLISLVNR